MRGLRVVVCWMNLALVGACGAAASGGPAPVAAPMLPVAPPPGTSSPPLQETGEPAHCTKETTVTCASLGFDAGTMACTATGDIDASACRLRVPVSDGPSPFAKATCGNGKIDMAKVTVCAPCPAGSGNCPCESSSRPVEDCDGKDLGGKTCLALGFLGGALACANNCTLDTSACSYTARGTAGWTVPGLVGVGEGNTVPASISVTGVTLGLAWTVPLRPASTQPPHRDPASALVFARSDLGQKQLHATRPFGDAFYGGLQLAANASGWLLAAHVFGDPPHTHVFPISLRGHAAATPTAIFEGTAIFFERGAPGEPSLLGLSIGRQRPNRHELVVVGVLIGADGHALGSGTPLELSDVSPQSNVLASHAAYVGGGRFLVARGAPGSGFKDFLLVDGRGTITPAAAPSLKGYVHQLVAGARGVTVAMRDGSATSIARVSTEGALLAPAGVATRENVLALIGPPDGPFSYLGRDGELVATERPRAPPSGPPPLSVFLARTTSGAEASFLLQTSRRADARVVRLR